MKPLFTTSQPVSLCKRNHNWHGMRSKKRQEKVSVLISCFAMVLGSAIALSVSRTARSAALFTTSSPVYDLMAPKPPLRLGRSRGPESAALLYSLRAPTQEETQSRYVHSGLGDRAGNGERLSGSRLQAETPDGTLIRGCLLTAAILVGFLAGRQLNTGKDSCIDKECWILATTTAREDDVLPDDVVDAMNRASQTTLLALREGQQRCIADVNLESSSGTYLSDEGAGDRWLALNHDFLEFLVRDGAGKVTAVFPNLANATLVQSRFPESPFSITTVSQAFNSRQFEEGTKVVVFVGPDDNSVERIRAISEGLEPSVATVLYNPRIGDYNVGKGEAEKTFLKSFLTTYSMRYVRGMGAVFRAYPAPWQIFRDDPDVPGRYELVTEAAERPAVWELDYLLSSQDEETAAVQGSAGDKEEGSSVVGYTFLYLLSAVPVFIGIGVVTILFVNSLQ